MEEFYDDIGAESALEAPTIPLPKEARDYRSVEVHHEEGWFPEHQVVQECQQPTVSPAPSTRSEAWQPSGGRAVSQ